MLQRIFSVALIIALTAPFCWSAEHDVKLVKGDNGWKMTVDGKDFYVKGFTWSHCPVGMKYDYDLFSESDADIKAALKRDMALIQTTGGNTIRGVVPKPWMKYVHETFGMHFISNDHCGRYGLEIDGKFVSKINYADPAAREVIKQNWRKIATEFRDAPGLIAHALGNENNYGLEWESAEIENLPEGERHKAKARYLYSMFNEVAVEIKKIDPKHPVGIVNGDLQYLDLIVELCPDIDYLAVNTYRGGSYSDLFDVVAQKLGKPVLLMETGCDAYNAEQKREDQLSQARMIHKNWVDLYRNTALNGGAGNCIGAMVFQLSDEWWKKGQQVNLTVHDTEGSWHHKWYKFDAAAEKNMNEEWFGVCSIREEAIDGAHLIQPRMAAFALRDLWQHDPYKLGEQKVKSLKLDEAKIAQESNAAAKQISNLLRKAELPYRKPKKLKLPAIVYGEGGTSGFWAASGLMPPQNALTIDAQCATQPHSGKTCMKISYNSGGDWAGIVWQNPENDWDNNSPGGYDLTGAKSLSFWARGDEGGEKVKISMGGPLTGKYPNTSSAELGEIVLTTKWKEHRLSLEGKDLRRIKNPLTLVVAGNGFPFRFYLDDVSYR